VHGIGVNPLEALDGYRHTPGSAVCAHISGADYEFTFSTTKAELLPAVLLQPLCPAEPCVEH
jgi:hypothetical protein